MCENEPSDQERKEVFDEFRHLIKDCLAFDPENSVLRFKNPDTAHTFAMRRDNLQTFHGLDPEFSARLMDRAYQEVKDERKTGSREKFKGNPSIRYDLSPATAAEFTDGPENPGDIDNLCADILACISEMHIEKPKKKLTDNLLRRIGSFFTTMAINVNQPFKYFPRND